VYGGTKTHRRGSEVEEIDDLDLVLLTPAVVRAWSDEVAPRAARLLAAAGYRGPIPDERGRVEEDGTLTIYVALPGGGEVSMSVPAGQWAWINAH
jgi:hypothetical protein